MSLYLDTSALAKLVTAERESEALREWIGAQQSFIATNIVGVVELQRVAARIDRDAVSRAVDLLAQIDQLVLSPVVIRRAALVPPPSVRSLDALHIASAVSFGDLEYLVTYDQRMAEAATTYGLPVESPGATSA